MKKFVVVFFVMALLICSVPVMAADLKAIKIGDFVTFGTYEQDNDYSDGPEEIEWIVLDIDNEKVTLISKYGLDVISYNNLKSTTWETSKLRDWLNDYFLTTAFTEEEQDMIATVAVPAAENPEYSVDPGNETQDKVFILSIEEANRFFGSKSELKCVSTEEARAYGARWDMFSGASSWWLRSPGENESKAAYVEYDGIIKTEGVDVDNGHIMVRPAIVMYLSDASYLESALLN